MITLFESVLFVVLIILLLIVRRLKDESTFLKNTDMLIGIAAILVGGHFSYVKLIKEKEDREKLAAVLNLGCELEKIGENDSCYLLRAHLSFENKSERRINVLFATFNVQGINIHSAISADPEPQLLDDRNFYYSRDFIYEFGKVLHSQKIISEAWIDYEQFSKFSYVIAIPKLYDVATMMLNVAITNQKTKIPEYYQFTDSITSDGHFKLNIMYNNDESIVDISDSLSSPERQILVDEYGLYYTYSECQIYLKDQK